jgi:hypothetical protein
MTAYNVVRYRVKAGHEEEFMRKHEAMKDRSLSGLVEGVLIKTGDRSYCLIGKWEDFDAIVAARPEMTATLDTFRELLEDLGDDLGVTDPVSGEVVVEI